MTTQDAENQPWYSIAGNNSDLEQGDFLDGFPVLIPNLFEDTFDFDNIEDFFNLEGSMKRVNVIILTQSCDMTNNAHLQTPIVVCPRYDALKARFNGFKISKTRWGNLRKNSEPNMLLLHKSGISGYEFDYQIVDFTNVFTAPLGYVRKFAETLPHRVKMTSPYREHLSKGFANKFSRIGLNNVIPEEFPYSQEQITEAHS